MKITKIALLAVVSILAVGSAAFGGEPTQVTSEFSKGYIPDGFDTNDHVQIVGEGTFANSCYRPAAYDVKVNHEEKTIAVNPKAYFYNGFCLQVLVPYNQTIDVGIMKVGSYDIVQGDKNEKLGGLKVRAATNSDPDDFMYAPIDQAYLQSENGASSVKLSGSFTNSCMKMVEVRVDVQPDVIVVLPITELEVQEDCRAGNFPFETTAAINEDVKKGRYLLHIRSLNGKAVNNLVDIQ